MREIKNNTRDIYGGNVMRVLGKGLAFTLGFIKEGDSREEYCECE